DRGGRRHCKRAGSVRLILQDGREIVAANGDSLAPDHDLIVDFDRIEIERRAEILERLEDDSKRERGGGLRFQVWIGELQLRYCNRALSDEVPGGRDRAGVLAEDGIRGRTCDEALAGATVFAGAR